VDFVAMSLAEAVDVVLKHSGSAKNYSSSPAESPNRTSALLQEILAFMRTVDRRNRAEDFSIAKLAGAVIQIVAVAALLWALFAMIRGSANEAFIRMLLAMVLQTMALTFFLLSQKR
jgi:hypothetical protein